MSKLRVGVAGPVGSGKTALVEALCRRLRERLQLAVVTNDIYTQEDAQFLTRAGALAPERIRGVETGGCPHTAIREDCSINRAAVQELEQAFPDLASACAARARLERQLTPAARDLLGAADAAPWLLRRWRALAGIGETWLVEGDLAAAAPFLQQAGAVATAIGAEAAWADACGRLLAVYGHGQPQLAQVCRHPPYGPGR